MRSSRRHRAKNRRGFTLVEVSISSVLTGFLLVASLSSAASSIRSQYRVSDRVTGQFLANGLIWEILSLDYMEAGLTSSAITRETGELSTTRVLYDDIDDYNGWSASPPQKKDGTAMTGYGGWQQAVAVVWVNVDDLSTVSASETGVKRITVTISRSGVVVATRIAVKTLVP